MNLADRFRCFIDDAWWPGTIIKRESFDTQRENSPFLCYVIRWDNGENEERLSPWDMFEFDELCKRNIFLTRSIVSMTWPCLAMESNELSLDKLTAFQPSIDDWPMHGFDTERERLLKGIDTLIQLDVTEQFRTPGNEK